MKQTIHILLILLIVTSTSGVSLSSHYCGNKLVSNSILLLTKTCCENGCKDCHTIVKQLKIDDFETTAFDFNFNKTVEKILALTHNSFLELNYISQNLTQNLFYKIKICDDLNILESKSVCDLQVFRL